MDINTIHLPKLILDCRSSREVFLDSHFCRRITQQQFGASLKATIVSDYLLQQGCCVHFLSLNCSDLQTLRLELRKPLRRLATGWWIESGTEGQGWWLPRAPVVRVYDRFERILEEKSLPTEGFQFASRSFVLTPESPCIIEFPLVEWIEPCTVETELAELEPIERLPMAKSRWYRYRSPGDFWDFVIRGQIYKTRHETVRLAGVCQQMALTVFLHLRFLAEQTGKRVYDVISDWTAYSVMLSLPLDGFWRHPDISDHNETHTRFQLDGILLLLEQYVQKSDARMLDVARKALDAVLSIAQPMESGGIWFIHDTYERSIDTVRLNYPRFLPSEAFGKQLSNTLCLNTHIWTLVTILRFQEVSARSVYDQMLQQGLVALRRVLEARPATWQYSTIYWIRDLFIRWSLNGGKRMRILQTYYDRWMETRLQRMKIHHPRLFMPNGYIERDLCASSLSDGYHFVTVRDLCVLYRQTRLSWLAGIIRRCVEQSLRNRWAEHGLRYDPRAVFILDILSLYSDSWSIDVQNDLWRLAKLCRDRGFGISSDWLTHPLIPRISLNLPTIWLSPTEISIDKRILGGSI